jgi:hypothetical protein
MILEFVQKALPLPGGCRLFIYQAKLGTQAIGYKDVLGYNNQENLNLAWLYIDYTNISQH